MPYYTNESIVCEGGEKWRLYRCVYPADRPAGAVPQASGNSTNVEV